MTEELSHADISNCDREPIHIPGTVQPHGVLFVVDEPELIVTHVSENVTDLFATTVEEVIGQPLGDLLGETAVADLAQALSADNLEAANPVRLSCASALYDGIVHRHDGATIIELEPVAGGSEEGVERLLRHALIGAQTADDLASLCQSLVVEIKRLTGFERTLLYRFDEQGHGSVDAEALDEGLEAYLGLHYPASDIPRQARELYLKNWLRIIPDARYEPARILPATQDSTGKPLDLSFSVLRSVSPVHLEYMANMGVRASMSVSLVVGGKLWGLISCANHSGPRFVSYRHRSACDVLGRLASLQIGALEDRHAAQQRGARRKTLDLLSRTLQEAPLNDEVLSTLIARPDLLLNIVTAHGAAAVYGDEVATCGQAPAPDWITRLSAWLDGQPERDLFATASLAADYPDAAANQESASGLLSFTLPGTPSRRLVFFRPEIVATVNWGGDPNKPVVAQPGGRLHPRRSFELWKEEVRSHSARWSPEDIEAAEDLRRDIVEIDLGRQVRKEQQAVRARDDLLAVVSHDLKNPLSIIQLQAHLLLLTVDAATSEPSRRVRACAERILRSVEQMDSLILNLRDLVKIEAGRVSIDARPENTRAMIDDALLILRSLAESKGVAIKADAVGSISVLADRDRFFQVLSNLIGNAVKFTPEGGSITIRVEESANEATVCVTDTGSGISSEELPSVFERYWRGRKKHVANGSGLGLFIVKGIVEAHGGRVWAESVEGAGTSVYFTLPKRPA